MHEIVLLNMACINRHFRMKETGRTAHIYTDCITDLTSLEEVKIKYWQCSCCGINPFTTKLL